MKLFLSRKPFLVKDSLRIQQMADVNVTNVTIAIAETETLDKFDQTSKLD